VAAFARTWVGTFRCTPTGGKHRDVDTDVVTAVGEGDCGDLQRAAAALLRLYLVRVFTVAVVLPRFPRRLET
jgi:hypothetical protein